MKDDNNYDYAVTYVDNNQSYPYLKIQTPYMNVNDIGFEHLMEA